VAEGLELQEYVTVHGRSPFGSWFERLDSIAAAKITIALTRLAGGNRSNCRSVGAGVQEVRINFGPGYRVNFGIDHGDQFILLGGGTKKRQQFDIVTARERWSDYKSRKERGS
jgi:putative addiction module killer protein